VAVTALLQTEMEVRQLQTQAVAAVALAKTTQQFLVVTGVLVLSSSGMPTPLMMPFLRQAPHPSATLVGTKSIRGLVLVQSRSEVKHGALCTT
jgi:hypothetical protein